MSGTYPTHQPLDDDAVRAELAARQVMAPALSRTREFLVVDYVRVMGLING